MILLGEEDLDLRNLSDEELERAWDLWFDLAQETNDFDPAYEHGVFVLVGEREHTRRCADGGPVGGRKI